MLRRLWLALGVLGVPLLSIGSVSEALQPMAFLGALCVLLAIGALTLPSSDKEPPPGSALRNAPLSLQARLRRRRGTTTQHPPPQSRTGGV